MRCPWHFAYYSLHLKLEHTLSLPFMAPLGPHCTVLLKLPASMLSSLWPSLLTLYTHTRTHVQFKERDNKSGRENKHKRAGEHEFIVVVSVAVNLTSPRRSPPSSLSLSLPVRTSSGFIEFILFRFVTIFAIIYLFASRAICVRVCMCLSVCVWMFLSFVVFCLVLTCFLLCNFIFVSLCVCVSSSYLCVRLRQ